MAGVKPWDQMTRKEVITAWVQALRSGDFVQGHGSLCREDKYGHAEHCCLGVACEVAIAHGMPLRRDLTTPNLAGDRWIVAYDGAADYLPGEVISWLDLDGDYEDPAVKFTVPAEYAERANSNGLEPLARLNDEFKCDFPQIAGAIEATFLTAEETELIPDEPEGSGPFGF